MRRQGADGTGPGRIAVIRRAGGFAGHTAARITIPT